MLFNQAVEFKELKISSDYNFIIFPSTQKADAYQSVTIRDKVHII